MWRKAHELMLETLKVSGEIRRIELLSLKSQIVRAAMSIPANIVEGRAQSTDAQFSRFLGIAIGSATELEYHLIVARDAEALCSKKVNFLLKKTVEVRKMLIGHRKTLSKIPRKGNATAGDSIRP